MEEKNTGTFLYVDTFGSVDTADCSDGKHFALFFSPGRTVGIF